MGVNNLKPAINKAYALLSTTDYNQLPISEYNKQYIARLKPALGYYLEIFAYCMNEGLKKNKLPLSSLTLVDFGGGSGFLSILAKIAGIGNVIYVDLNERSVQTITLLKKRTGVGPDVILQGSADRLATWCTENETCPELLIATDLIEHVYDLHLLFRELISINHQMHMIFTTASTPYNPYVKRKLYRTMDGCEYGQLEQPNYLTKRINYIKEFFPHLSEKEATHWAKCTRGLIYADINEAIKTNRQLMPDAHNTCDPETGNWTERILPIHVYKNTLAVYDYKIDLQKGFYNSKRPVKWQSITCRIINGLIRHTGKAGFFIAPFIVLSCNKK